MSVDESSGPARRKQLREQYKQARPEAGVYLVRNSRNSRVLLGSTPDLASIRNKLTWAKATNTISALDRRLVNDAREHGLEAFSLETLEVLDVKPEMSREDILEDLATLESLWRERLDPLLLY